MANKKGKSKSVKQQKLMGMAYAYAKGDLKDTSPEVKFVAKSFLDSEEGKKKGLKNLKAFASTKHINLPQKVKESKIMRFNELANQDPSDVVTKLYNLGNGDINGLVNDLAKVHGYEDKKEIIEDILFALDDIDGMTPEKFNEFEDGLKKYISEQ